jgi:hypothetical protein
LCDWGNRIGFPLCPFGAETHDFNLPLPDYMLSNPQFGWIAVLPCFKHLFGAEKTDVHHISNLFAFFFSSRLVRRATV